MAYVVRRPGNRWEIRESFASPRGPRSRTLVSFTTLADDVLVRAARAARTPFHREAVLRSARRSGAPIAAHPADALATSLLRQLTRPVSMRPGLRSLLAERLAQVGPMPPAVDDDLAHWIGATPDDRGAALVDLLGLADHLPEPRATHLRYPGLARHSVRAG